MASEEAQRDADREIDQAVREVPQAMVDLFDQLPLWIWQTDADHNFTYFSDNFEEITGKPKSWALGRSRKLILTETVRQNAQTLQHLEDLDKHEPFENFLYRHKFRPEKSEWIRTSGLPIFDDQGAFQGYRGTAMLVTEVAVGSKLAREAERELFDRTVELEDIITRRTSELEQSNHLLNEVLEAMSEGIMVTSGDNADEHDVILRLNAAYRRLFALEKQDVPDGMLVRDFLQMLADRGDEVNVLDKAETVADAIASGRTALMELSNRKTFFNATASKRPSGGLVIMHSDVTELHERNQALEQARDNAEVANKAKSNFLATMSHEIRTPMNGIVGITELLTDTALNSEQAEYVETIRSSALALTGLISDILDFSKIEAGRMTILPAPFDLHRLLQEVTDLLSPMAVDKGLVFALDLSETVPQRIVADALRLRQVLLNLIGNALKFTEQGSVTLHVTSDDGVRFDVIDTGVGIPDDQIMDIFTPFEQAQSGHSRRFEGTGLGLSITRELITSMGGEITLHSELGKGTVVTVELPLRSGENRSVSDPVVSPTAGLRLDGVRVLLVEDNATNQLVARRMLEGRGAVVEVAGNGQEAVHAFHPDTYDVVLMDVSMPVMTGLEASKIIREREVAHGWPHRPIIALTGNAFRQDERDARAAGMDGFLTKPIAREPLLSCITEHLLVGTCTEQGTTGAEA